MFGALHVEAEESTVAAHILNHSAFLLDAGELYLEEGAGVTNETE